MNEIDYNLDVETDGVIAHKDSEAIRNDIAEWIATPQGEIHGMPSWGNLFANYRHHPQGSVLEVALESHIVTKLPKDVPSAIISGVRFKSVSIDKLKVSILTPYGIVHQPVSL